MELSYQQTNRSILNSSISKQQYQFPKAKRFKQYNKSSPNARFYTLPSTITYRKEKAPSFPKLVRKMEFPEEKSKKIIPSPSTYSIKSDIEKSTISAKGISIPKSSRYHLKTLPVPGPLDYNPKKQPFLTARYSIGNSKKKLQYPLELQKGKQSPGPSYLVNLQKLQKFVSTYSNKQCTRIYTETIRKKNLSSTANPQKQFGFINTRQNLQRHSSLQRYTTNTEPKSTLILKNQHSFSLLLNSNKKPASKITTGKLNFQQYHSQSKLLNTQPSILGKFGKAQRKTIFEQKSQTPGPAYSRFSEFSKLQKKVYNDRIKAKDKKKNLNIKQK